jgi:hypothetical protein
MAAAKNIVFMDFARSRTRDVSLNNDAPWRRFRARRNSAGRSGLGPERPFPPGKYQTAIRRRRAA